MIWVERTVFITLILLFIQNIIYTKYGLKKIKYERYFDKKSAFEGESVDMVEILSNDKLLPLPWLRIESKISKNLVFKHMQNLNIKYGSYHKSIFSLMPYMKITRKHHITCTKRGAYKLNHVTLGCGTLFGGISNSYHEMDINSLLYVYPKLLPLDKLNIPTHSWLGDVTVKRWIVNDPFLIAGVRAYMPTDPYNMINWKATARSNTLQVNKRDFTAESRMVILLNIDMYNNQWTILSNTESIEQGIRLCASYCNLAIKRGIEVGFVTNGILCDNRYDPVVIEPKLSKQHLMNVFEHLAKLVIERRISFHKMLTEEIKRGKSGLDYLVLSTFMSKEIKQDLKILEGMGNSITFKKLEILEEKV